MEVQELTWQCFICWMTSSALKRSAFGRCRRTFPCNSNCCDVLVSIKIDHGERYGLRFPSISTLHPSPVARMAAHHRQASSSTSPKQTLI